MSIVYRGFTEEELDTLHTFLVEKATTLESLKELYDNIFPNNPDKKKLYLVISKEGGYIISEHEDYVDACIKADECAKNFTNTSYIVAQAQLIKQASTPVIETTMLVYR